MPLDPKYRQLVAACDLEERLSAVPPSAKLRGLYFTNTEHVLEQNGLLNAYKEYFPETYSAVRWYPVSDFLVRLAVAASLLRGPSGIKEGLQEIGHGNALAFAASLLGRTMLRLLARDPVKLLRQACAGRRQSCIYGRWEVTFPGPGHAVMEMFEEYLWIESNVLGAAIGTFHAAGHDVSVEVELDGMFRGRHVLRWTPP